MTEGSHPGMRRLLPPDRPEQQGARRGYLLKRYTQAQSALNFVQEFQGIGTHLYLHELNGSDTIMVRIDAPNANWIEMEEGDTIVRDFTRFWVRSSSKLALLGLGGPVEATFFSSIGPLVLRAPKKYGLRDGFFTLSATATDVGVNAFGGFAAQYAAQSPNGQVPAFGKYGGAIIIRNTHATQPLYVYMGTPGGFAAGGTVYPSPAQALEIPALTTISLQIENRLSNLRHPWSDTTVRTLVLAAPTGIEIVARVTLSRMNIDYTDPESLPAGATQVPLEV